MGHPPGVVFFLDIPFYRTRRANESLCKMAANKGRLGRRGAENHENSEQRRSGLIACTDILNTRVRMERCAELT